MNVAARVREEIEAGARTRVLELAGGDLARVSASVVDEACGQGDGYALALWDEVGELLGTSIANLVTILNPARVILGGGVLLGAVRLAALVRRHLGERASRSAARALSVERAWLGDDAGVIGAAVLERRPSP
jgi:glucokinase